MAPILTHEEARRVYDKIGEWQDFQFYENKALEDLVSHGGFDRAGSVLEFGCGTGRLAETLFKKYLPGDCRYLGLDISPTMVRLARERLKPWQARAEVVLTDGSLKLDVPDSAFDRFVSTYVLDLLSEEDIRAVLGEAHRSLRPGGLVCLTGLTCAKGLFGRIITRLWERVHSLRPTLVGGCRPINIKDYLNGERWHIIHHNRITALGISSEVLVASRL
jgi:ubiquinone/menaquinone biosynthesis C-methylase UbiE